MINKPLLTALIAAIMITFVTSAHADVRWTSSPYAQKPLLVLEGRTELEQRVIEISTFPTELDPRLWQKQKLRPEVRQRVIEVSDALLSDLNVEDVSIQSIEVRGSNVSFEYDDLADFGVRVFLDTSKYKGNIDDLAARVKDYNAFIESRHEGKIFLYAVPLEVNFYVIRTARLNPVKGVGHYSISEDTWMELPTIQESKFERQKMLHDLVGFTSTYNDLISTYFADKRSFDCAQWNDFSKDLSKYRNEGIVKSGTRSTENLVYRLLRRLSVNVIEQSSDLELECRNIHWSLD